MHPDVYGLLAEFETSEALIRAAKESRREGYQRLEAYSPFPVEDLAEILGQKRTVLPALILGGGILGAVGGLFLQYYANVLDYPLNVGGRPLASWPAFVPIAFETTILAAALTAIFGLLILNGLPHPHHPLFGVPSFDAASKDRFFLCVRAEDPMFERERTHAFLNHLSPLSVSEVPL